MFQGLQESQLAGAIEAMLFVTDEPVGVITLADMLEVDPAQVEAALVELRDKLAAEERGVQLREVAGGWRLFTHPVYHELIEKYVISWDTRRLSQAALETLAVVAYSQPVTRGQVAAVRGVNSDSSINSLVEKGLLREAGTADAPGNPVLYATTRAFLEKFGLRSTADTADGQSDVDSRSLTRIEQLAFKENLSVGNRNDVCGDICGNIAGLCFNDRKRSHASAAEGIGKLSRTLQKTGMQIEYIPGVSFTPGGAFQKQTQRAVCNRMLG